MVKIQVSKILAAFFSWVSRDRKQNIDRKGMELEWDFCSLSSLFFFSLFSTCASTNKIVYGQTGSADLVVSNGGLGSELETLDLLFWDNNLTWIVWRTNTMGEVDTVSSVQTFKSSMTVRPDNETDKHITRWAIGMKVWVHHSFLPKTDRVGSYHSPQGDWAQWCQCSVGKGWRLYIFSFVAKLVHFCEAVCCTNTKLAPNLILCFI